MSTSLSKKAVSTLDNNRKIKKTKYTPPSPDHYPNGYLWDSNFVAIVYSALGEAEKAAVELEQVLSWQNKKTGFIPNMKLGRGRYFDPERFTFTNPDLSSNYTQPPYHARAAYDIYKALGKKRGLDFLKRNYTQLSSAYKYFIDFRQNGDNALIGIIHPHETGRDSDPTFDFIKLRLGSNGMKTVRTVRYINSGLDYASALFLNLRLRAVRWNVNKLRKEKVFWVNDVMFNCIYANNLEVMGKIAKVLGKRRDEKLFNTTFKKVEHEIVTNLWGKKTEMFYARNSNGKYIQTVSISNLAPLMLKAIKPHQVEKLLELLEDKNKFATRFPIPSVPKDSKNYDPNYDELRLWRGPTWINTNWMMIEALFMQAARFKNSNSKLSKRLRNRAILISEKTIELGKKGFWEFYNPDTGKGLRLDNFAWSTLTAVIEKDYLEKTISKK